MNGLFDAIPQSLRLYELTQLVSRTVNTRPELHGVWVTAEIGNLAVRGGHCYLELIEKNERQETIAKLRATIWAGNYHQIRSKFEKLSGQTLAAGIKVMLRGGVTFHDIYGMSFNVSDIDPNYTLGDMVRLRREILARLTREGIVDNNKQLPTPCVPQRIAVISASGAAGYGDFINQLLHNSFGIVFYPVLFEAIVQGARTVPTVIDALQRIGETADYWDCVIIIRGGGATSDLMDFDNYELAREVATFPLPIVVGIGHERDRTVLDEIANVRVKTPTAAAEWCISTAREFYERVSGYVRGIAKYSTEAVAGEGRRLTYYEGVIPSRVRELMAAASAQLSRATTSLPLLAGEAIARERKRLDYSAGMIRNAAGWVLQTAARDLQAYPQRIFPAARMSLARASERLTGLERLLNAVRPENILARGYSVTRLNGHAIKDLSELQPGSVITTTLLHGTIESEIKNLKQE